MLKQKKSASWRNQHLETYTCLSLHFYCKTELSINVECCYRAGCRPSNSYGFLFVHEWFPTSHFVLPRPVFMPVFTAPARLEASAVTALLMDPPIYHTTVLTDSITLLCGWVTAWNVLRVSRTGTGMLTGFVHVQTKYSGFCSWLFFIFPDMVVSFLFTSVCFVDVF